MKIRTGFDRESLFRMMSSKQGKHGFNREIFNIYNSYYGNKNRVFTWFPGLITIVSMATKPGFSHGFLG